MSHLKPSTRSLRQAGQAEEAPIFTATAGHREATAVPDRTSPSLVVQGPDADHKADWALVPEPAVAAFEQPRRGPDQPGPQLAAPAGRPAADRGRRGDREGRPPDAEGPVLA